MSLDGTACWLFKKSEIYAIGSIAQITDTESWFLLVLRHWAAIDISSFWLVQMSTDTFTKHLQLSNNCKPQGITLCSLWISAHISFINCFKSCKYPMKVNFVNWGLLPAKDFNLMVVIWQTKTINYCWIFWFSAGTFCNVTWTKYSQQGLQRFHE